MEYVSKTKFKAHALELLRDIEKTGQAKIITDRGKPTIEIRKLREQEISPLEKLKGSVIRYDNATAPVATDDWENA